MRIGEVMTRRVETIEPGATADAAFERMQARGIRHLVVMDGKAVVGVLSERDLGGRAGAEVRRGRSVADLMSRGVAFAGPHDTIRAAANRMRGASLGCLPVIEDGRLVGLLTVSDVLLVVGRGAQKPIVVEERKAMRRGPRPAKLGRASGRGAVVRGPKRSRGRR